MPTSSTVWCRVTWRCPVARAWEIGEPACLPIWGAVLKEGSGDLSVNRAVGDRPPT